MDVPAMSHNSGARRYVGFNERYFGRPSKPGNKQDAHGDTPPPAGPTGPPRVFVQDSDFTLYVGDVRECLRELPAASVHTVVTSPPYWGLRDYGTGAWDGGDPDCDHRESGTDRGKREELPKPPAGWAERAQGSPFSAKCGKCGATRVDQQLGLEPTPEAFVAAMVDVFREVRRVLRDDGTLWLNLGDSYAPVNYGANAKLRQESPGSDQTLQGRVGHWAADIGGSRSQQMSKGAAAMGIKQKDLCGIPWRVAFALQADGWVLRSDIVWSKPNPMPESVTDRPTKSHEYLFMLSKAEWKGIDNPLRLDRADAMWFAAMMDGEGSICVNRRKGRTDDQVTYSAALRCYNASRDIIDRVAELAGCGTISHKTGSGEGHYRDVWVWQCGGQTAVPVLDALEPYLIAKRQQAHLLLELQGMRRHHGNRPGFGSGAKPRPAALTIRQEEIARGCAELNRTGTTDVPVVAWKRGYWKPYPYSFDQEAVREPHQTVDGFRGNGNPMYRADHFNHSPGGRNVRSVWEIATQPYPEAHFATFPEALPERCIRAGTSERGCCPVCGAPWVREVERTPATVMSPRSEYRNGAGRNDGNRSALVGAKATTLGWVPTCTCLADKQRVPVAADVAYAPVPCVVLDPFMGSGTTALVARRLGRRSIGVELNPEYAALCARRLQQLSLLAEV